MSNGDLHLERRARSPRRHRERGLQFLELAPVLTVGVHRAGQVVEIEQLLGLEVPLHPFVKRRAQQRLRIRTPRQPPIQPLRDGVGIATEFDHRAHRELRG